MTFFGFQISGFSGPRFPKSSPLAGLGACLSHLDLLEHSSAVAPRWLRGGSRTTKCGRSKEVGQYRENPISASPVWGMLAHLCLLVQLGVCFEIVILKVPQSIGNVPIVHREAVHKSSLPILRVHEYGYKEPELITQSCKIRLEAFGFSWCPQLFVVHS